MKSVDFPASLEINEEFMFLLTPNKGRENGNKSNSRVRIEPTTVAFKNGVPLGHEDLYKKL